MQGMALLQKDPVVVFQPLIAGKPAHGIGELLPAEEVVLFTGDRLPIELGPLHQVLVGAKYVADQRALVAIKLFFGQVCFHPLHKGLHGIDHVRRIM